MPDRLLAVTLAVALVLAGCSAAPGPGTSEGGTVTVYVSDQPNAITEFEHLDVTVTAVSVHRTAANGSGESTDGDGEWVVDAFEPTTVDLPRLRGENATTLSQVAVPNGTYDQVRLHVDAVDGTLASGENVTVKLPSSRLKLRTNFTVRDGQRVGFVFDVTVFRAGNSGKYILKPVASESGTDVAVNRVEQ